MSSKLNPALHTFNEYLNIINEQDIHHPSTAYQMSVATIQKYSKPKDYPELVNQFYANGILFQLRTKKLDTWADNYIKTRDDGFPLRDKDNNIVYLSLEEKEIKLPERYEYQSAIIDVERDRVAAYTDTEWGAMLVVVASEYQGFGIGAKIHHHHRSQYPDLSSGGLTPCGLKSLYKTYQKMVSDTLRSGEYRKAYLTGSLSYDRINSILSSAKVTSKHIELEREFLRKNEYAASSDYTVDSYRRPRFANKVNLNFSNKEDWLLHIQDNYAILYDKKMFDLLKKEENFESFLDDGIHGYIYIGGVYGAQETPKLFRSMSKNEKIKNMLTEVMLNNQLQEPIRMTKNEAEAMQNKLGDKITSNHIAGSMWFNVTLMEKTIHNIPAFSFIEKTVRQQLDSYNEGFTIIHEMASALAEEAHEIEMNSDTPRWGMSM